MDWQRDYLGSRLADCSVPRRCLFGQDQTFLEDDAGVLGLITGGHDSVALFGTFVKGEPFKLECNKELLLKTRTTEEKNSSIGPQLASENHYFLRGST